MKGTESALHDLEAEQRLLGAILVNNYALQQVEAFLDRDDFFDPIHKKLYEIARSLVCVGKIASPMSVKIFLPPDLDIAGLTAPMYLARLAAEAARTDEAHELGITIRALSWARCSERQFRVRLSVDLSSIMTAIQAIERRLPEIREPSAQPNYGASELAAFRKHLSQGYAMLKRLEEGENTSRS